jgi:hypothetical protein
MSMPISEATHDALDEIELLRLIEACNECTCPPHLGCYCERNRQWGEAKLQEVRARKAARIAGQSLKVENGQ